MIIIQIIDLNCKGRKFKLKLEQTENYLKFFDDYVSEISENNHVKEFVSLWGDEATNSRKDILKSKEELKSKLHKLDIGDYSEIYSLVASIDLTKKGKFWKGRVKDFFTMESATTYFTDYTNAWNTIVLRLKVLDGDTVGLSFVSKDYTL